MQKMGLHSVRTTAKHDYVKNNAKPQKENVLKCQFNAERPDQVWVSDVSCFKLHNRYYYLCVILDLFSRKVVAHRISKKNSTQLVTWAFKNASAERKPAPGLVFHSDRGTLYTSHAFQKLLLSFSAKHSFSNSGKPYDNAVAESFFATLKKEEFYRRDYSSDAAFHHGIDSYIKFYNNKRPHRTLKYMTPSKFEEALAVQGDGGAQK